MESFFSLLQQYVTAGRDRSPCRSNRRGAWRPPGTLVPTWLAVRAGRSDDRV